MKFARSVSFAAHDRGYIWQQVRRLISVKALGRANLFGSRFNSDRRYDHGNICWRRRQKPTFISLIAHFPLLTHPPTDLPTYPTLPLIPLPLIPLPFPLSPSSMLPNHDNLPIEFWKN